MEQPPASLDDLTPEEKALANEFLDALVGGRQVNFLDFPGWEQEEFERVADAVVAAVMKRH